MQRGLAVDEPLRPRPARGLAVVLRLAPDDGASGSPPPADWATAGPRDEPDAGRHQRLPAAAGRHPDLRARRCWPGGRRTRWWCCASDSPAGGEYDADAAVPGGPRGPPAMLLPTPGDRPRARPSWPARHGCDSALFGAAAPARPARRRAAATPGVGRAGRRRPTGTRWAGRRCPGARQLLRRIARGLDVVTYISEYTRARLAPALDGPHPAGPALARAWTSTVHPGRRRRRGAPAVRAGRRGRWSSACPGWSPRKGQDVLVARAGRAVRARRPGARAAARRRRPGPEAAALRRAIARGGLGHVRRLHRRGAAGRAAGALRGRRRVRDAVPHPARRAGRRGPRHRLPGGGGLRPAGGGRRLRRRAGGGAGGRDRVRGRPALAGAVADAVIELLADPARARRPWGEPAGPGSSSGGRGGRSPRRSPSCLEPQARRRGSPPRRRTP